MPETTRFSMLTADRAESSIHDLFHEQSPILSRQVANRDAEIIAIRAQLDDILDHVCTSVTWLTSAQILRCGQVRA